MVQLYVNYISEVVCGFYHKADHGVNRPISFTLLQHIQIDLSFIVNDCTGRIGILRYMQFQLVSLKYDFLLRVYTINHRYSVDNITQIITIMGKLIYRTKVPYRV